MAMQDGMEQLSKAPAAFAAQANTLVLYPQSLDLFAAAGNEIQVAAHEIQPVGQQRFQHYRHCNLGAPAEEQFSQFFGAVAALMFAYNLPEQVQVEFCR